jgi:hypothetical protein
MFATRFPSVPGPVFGLTLIFALVLLVSPSCYAAGLVCGPAGLEILAVPNNPFTADFVQGQWEILPDGSRSPVPLKEGEAVPVWGKPNLVHRVARDSEGRVLVERPAFNSTTSRETHEPDGWSSATICDPVAGTITTLGHGIAVKEIKDPATGERLQTFTDIEGKATVKPWIKRTSRDFSREFDSCSCGWQDLGLGQVDGIATHRYRFLKHDDADGIARPDFREYLISNELEAQLSNTTVNTVDNEERGVKLIHVRRVEPDTAVYPFKIPADYTVTDSDDKPQTPALQSIFPAR